MFAQDPWNPALHSYLSRVSNPSEAAGDRWPFKGWQRLAAHACDKRACEMHFSDLTPASRALLLS